MNNAWTKLKDRWNENPIQVIVVASVAAASAAKLITAMSEVQGRRAYAKSVRLREQGR